MEYQTHLTEMSEWVSLARLLDNCKYCIFVFLLTLRQVYVRVPGRVKPGSRLEVVIVGVGDGG